MEMADGGIHRYVPTIGGFSFPVVTEVCAVSVLALDKNGPQ